MSGQQRHREPIDVHLILRRDKEAGAEVLLSHRAGDVYASGLWHLVSGHLDGPHEDVVDALIREAAEEAGVSIDAAEVRFAVAVHHRSPGGKARTGLFFEVRAWQGTPYVREPAVCDAMGWFPLDALPEPMVAYCRSGLDTYRSGQMMAVHFQEPGDPIAYDPAFDRSRPVPAVGTSGPGPRLRDFTERAVGRITGWTDASWAREGNQVWRAHSAAGGVWFVKVHQNERFHQREVTALRTWTPLLGAAAPRLVTADEKLRAVVLTAVPGRTLHGVVLSSREKAVFRGIGALARRIHHASPPRPAPAGSGPAVGKAERHLAAAGPHLEPGDAEFVRDLVRQAQALPPLEWVETHGDFQLRNILHTDADSAENDGFLGVIDFERSEPGPAVRDLVRLSDAWAGRPDLYESLLTGYGRPLTAVEEEHLVVEAALDSVSGIQFGAAHGDPELVERGKRTLKRLRAAAAQQTRSPGGMW